MANAWTSFLQGATAGYAMGKDVKKRREEDALKDELSQASRTNVVEQQTSGDEAMAKFNENFVPQEGGPATAQEYLAQNPEIAASMEGRKAGFTVRGQAYDSQEDASIAARSANMREMAKVYSANNDAAKAVLMDDAATDVEAKGLQLKSARRRNKDEAYRERLDNLIRNHGSLSDEDFAKEAAQIATNGVPDGQGFLWSKDPKTGQLTVAQYDRESRQVVGTKPATREQIMEQLISYSSASEWSKSQDKKTADARWEREVKHKENTLAETTRHNKAIERLAGERNGLYRQAAAGQNLSEEDAGKLNNALVYEEIAKQQAKENPAAAKAYRNAAIQTIGSLPQKVQLAFRGKLGAAPQGLDQWDQPVEVERVDPNTGTKIKMNVPLRVADPEGYKKYTDGLKVSEGEAKAFGEKPAGQPVADRVAVEFPNREQYTSADPGGLAIGPKLGLFLREGATGTAYRTPEWEEETKRRREALYGRPVSNGL